MEIKASEHSFSRCSPAFAAEKTRTPMRQILHKQLGLVSRLEHARAKELVVMSDVLDQLPEAAAVVHGALVAAGGDPDKGREAMTAEQVPRAMIIKQLNRFSYEELAFHL